MYFLETAICKILQQLPLNLSLYVRCLFFKVHPNAISDSLPVHLSCQFQSHDLLDRPAYSKQNSPAHSHYQDPECSFPPASLGSPIHNHSTYSRDLKRNPFYHVYESFYCHHIRNFILSRCTSKHIDLLNSISNSKFNWWL